MLHKENSAHKETYDLFLLNVRSHLFAGVPVAQFYFFALMQILVQVHPANAVGFPQQRTHSVPNTPRCPPASLLWTHETQDRLKEEAMEDMECVPLGAHRGFPCDSITPHSSMSLLQDQ